VANAAARWPRRPPRLVNRDALRTQGIELEVSMALGAAGRISGNASALSPKVEGATAADAWPRNRSRRLASLNWTGNLAPGWTLGVHERHVGYRRDSSIPTGDGVLAAYDRVDVDLHTRLAVPGGLEVGAGVRNLFGARYQEMIGFPAQRTQVWVGLGRVW
jgi:outer membrane receptor protein involved in Fe transport